MSSLRRDADKAPETKTFAEVQKMLSQYINNYDTSEYGFCLTSDSKVYLDFLTENLRDLSSLPVQINSGSLMNMNIVVAPTTPIPEALAVGKIKLFVHLPFLINPWNSTQQYINNYFIQLASLYKGLPAKFILHCSYPKINPAEDYDKQMEPHKKNFIQNLQLWQSLLGHKLLIENLAGSASHKEPYSSVAYLHQIMFVENNLHFDKFGLCFDTEHAWANGESLIHSQDIVNHIDLIHMNSAPSNAGFGKHIDLHSYTPIRSSHKRVFSVECNNESVSILADFIKTYRGIPKVFERAHMSIAADDALFIKEFSTQNS